jgi:site-specific recombinase
MRHTDLTRDRKLRATLRAMTFLLLGLGLCLLAAYWVKESGALLAGIYTTFALGIGGALGLFINGNVKVHQATADAPPPGTFVAVGTGGATSPDGTTWTTRTPAPPASPSGGQP